MARVAVIVPNWNSLRYLKPCLDSVAAADEDLELMVVDNGSEDGSAEWLAQQGTPHLALSQNSGFSAAVNLGASRTQAPYLLVLNADATLDAACATQLANRLDAEPKLGGVQPLIVQASEPPDQGPTRSDPTGLIYSAGQALTADGRGYELEAGQPLERAPSQPTEIFGVCGAACLLRRPLFTELGGYDESYFAFCEDVDLNLRAQIMGWRFELVPEAIAWHLGNAVWKSGFSSPAAENARLVARNRLATQVKFLPARALPRLAAVEAGALLRAAVQRRLRATARGKRQALADLPRLRETRRQLRERGELACARAWLGASGRR